MLAFPIRGPLLPVARDLYLNVERNIIQYDAAAARWDPELFYTLRPGRFVFAQPEFRHEFRVNGIGLRDEETAVSEPEIIVLGDSFTMGWGVAQDETYPKRLEVALGRRTLNAGMSSYGTVRQLRLLDRLDIRRLRYLVIQYNGDDVVENLVYWRRGNRHVSRDEAQWQRIARGMVARRAYFPGKHTWDALRRAVRRIWPKPSRAHAAAEPDAADLFLNALAHALRADLRGARLVVWEMPDSHVAAHLPERLQRGAYGPVIRAMTIVDVASHLDRRRDFWVLDDHLNASGHREVAERLTAAIRALEGSLSP
jgi:hypothetical protein